MCDYLAARFLTADASEGGLEILACHEVGVTVTLPSRRRRVPSQMSGLCLFAGGRRLSLSGWGATAVSLYERGGRQADKSSDDLDAVAIGNART